MADEKKLIDWKTIVTDFGLPLLADVITRGWIFKDRRPGDQELVQEMVKLVKEGKPQEAKKIMEARAEGQGLYDESIFLSILGLLKRKGALTDAQIARLIAFLDELPEKVRTNFRIGLTLDPDENHRYYTLLTLAQLKDDEERKKWLRSSGFYDPHPAMKGWGELKRIAGMVGEKLEQKSEEFRADAEEGISALRGFRRQLKDRNRKLREGQ